MITTIIRSSRNMKKILLSLSLVVAAVFATHASNCFTFSVGDTLLVNPATIYDNVTVPIDASFCGRVDQWEITFTCSTGVHVRNYMRGYSMIVPFINRLGQDTTLHCGHHSIPALSAAR